MTERNTPQKPQGDNLRAIVFQVELEPIASSELPVSVAQVLPVGDVHVVDGRGDFRVSELSVVSILHYFGSTRTDLAFDYDHGMYYGDNMLAAGWGEKVWAIVPEEWVSRIKPFLSAYSEDRVDVMAGDESVQGVYVFTRWTAGAAEKIQSREYRYISPVVFFNYAGEAEYIWNAALVNAPAIDGMEPLAASRLPAARAIETETLTEAVEPAEMKGAENMKMETFAAVLDIDVDPTAEDFDAEAFSAKVEEALGGLKERAEQAEALAAENLQVKVERDEANEALAATVAERDALRKAQEQAESERRNLVLEAAISDGRLAASQREWAEGNWDAFEALLPTLTANPSGPPQGEEHAHGTQPDDLGDDDPSEKVIKAYAKEHSCSFTDAFIALGKLKK